MEKITARSAEVQKPKPKRKRIEILPREPLTKKARAAIETYALNKTEDCRIAQFLIKATLDAERMRRSDLYEWLEDRGYRWFSKYGYWKKPDR